MAGRWVSSTRKGEADSGDALFCRQGPKCSDPKLLGNEPEPLDSEKGSRDEAGAELRSRLGLQLGAAPQFMGAELLTPAVNATAVNATVGFLGRVTGRGPGEVKGLG
jgi:hypothetical protein